MRVSVTVNCIARGGKPGTSSATHNPVVANRISASNAKKPLTERKTVHESRWKVLASSVASSGTSTWVREKLVTTKMSWGSAPDAKNASVSRPIPSWVTTYHGIRMASTALQIANPARMRLNLIKRNILGLVGESNDPGVLL